MRLIVDQSSATFVSALLFMRSRYEFLYCIFKVKCGTNAKL